MFLMRTINMFFRSKGRLNLLRANITKWSNTLKQFVAKLPTNCLSVFDNFVGLAVKGLKFPRISWLIFTKSDERLMAV